MLLIMTINQEDSKEKKSEARKTRRQVNSSRLSHSSQLFYGNDYIHRLAQITAENLRIQKMKFQYVCISFLTIFPHSQIYIPKSKIE